MSQATADSAETTAVEEAQAPASDSNHETTTTPEAGTQGQGGSGEADSSQEASTPTLADRLAGVDTVEDYEAMMAEVANNPNAFENPSEDLHPDQQAEQAAAQQGEEQSPPEGAEQAEGEEAEGEEEESPAEGAEAAESQEVTEVEEVAEEEPEAEGEALPRFRLRPTDKVDAEAMRIKKAADAAQSPISLSEALAIAKRKLGIEDKPAAADSEAVEAEGDADDPTEGVTLIDAKADLKQLRKDHSQALRDGDLDEAADVMDRIGETEDLIELIADRDAQASTTARAQHDQAFEASVARATDLFPDFGDAKSEFYERCNEIDQALRDTDDPRYFEPEKPLMIAQMAAKELNVAPGARKAAPKAKKAVEQPEKTAPAPAAEPQQKSSSPQPPRTEKPGQLPAASGASRTSGAPTGAAASLAEQVANIESPEDFEKLALQVHQATR